MGPKAGDGVTSTRSCSTSAIAPRRTTARSRAFTDRRRPERVASIILRQADDARQEPKVCRLAAGGKWIRIFGSASLLSSPRSVARGPERGHGSARFFLCVEPFHGARGGIGWGGLRLSLLRGEDLLGLLAHEFISAPARHWGIEHFQGSAAGIDLVVMGEIGEAFEDTEQLLVPGTPSDLDVAGAALRAERPEPRQLIAGLRSRAHGKAAERTHQVMSLALAGLPRILAEPDADPFAVLRGGIEQQSFDVARIGAPAHHVQEPVAATSIAAKFDADRPIGVVELGLFGSGQIPIADDVVELRRDLIDHRAPLSLEIEPGGRPDL